MSISYRQAKKDTRSPIAKLADRIHLAEFPEEYAHMNDSHADAAARRQGQNPMNTDYIEQVNLMRQIRGVGPLGSDGRPTDNKSRDWAWNKAKRDFTSKLDNALFNNDPMGTGCVQNYCTDEYDRITQGIIERITSNGAESEPLHEAILNELTAWFDQDLVDRPQVHRAVMATLTDLI